MEQVHALQPVLLLLFVSIVAVFLVRPLRMSPIVGYLAAGVLVGPYGLSIIEESKTTHLLAELGVVFLLFDIGLHFSLPRLWEARRDILGLGPLQMALCTLALSLVLLKGAELPTELAIVLGATLALSSTAVATETVKEYSQESCPVGQSATAVLIFQDVCAIFLLILVASMGSGEASLALDLGSALVKAALAFVGAIVLGRYLIGPLFAFLSRSKHEEIFTATTLLVVLATGAATAAVGLSLTLGAFLSGMIISETPYRHVIQTEVKPFRGLLLGFFFITVGMALNLQVLALHWPRVLLALVLIVLVKAVFVYLAALLLRMPSFISIQIGVLLSQGSEFAFVILALPLFSGALASELSSILIAAVAASMALTPSLSSLGHRLTARLADEAWKEHADELTGAEEGPAEVVIIGMSEVGRQIAHALDDHGIAYKAFDFDHDRFVTARTDGYAVAFGDLADLRLAETIQMAEARILAIAVPREQVAAEVGPTISVRYPNLTRFVSATTAEEAKRFKALGATPIVSYSFPKGVDLAGAVLNALGIPDDRIEKWIKIQQDRALEIDPEIRVAEPAA